MYRCTECDKLVPRDRRLEIPALFTKKFLYKCPFCRGKLEQEEQEQEEER